MKNVKTVLITPAVLFALTLLMPILAANQGMAGPPETTTKVATEIKADSAKLNGDVNPKGLDTVAMFLYGKNAGSYSNISVILNVSGSKGNTAVSDTVSGLSPGKPYYYKLVAQNSDGTSYDGEMSFDTSASASSLDIADINAIGSNAKPMVVPTPTPPLVTTGVATAITSSSATLNGTVDTNGLFPPTYYTFAVFLYGTTSGSYTNISPVVLVTGTNPVAISGGISGLSSGTTYYYKLSSSNTLGGIGYGVEDSFTTLIPTAIELASFNASTNGDDGVILTWETATETENAGFNIYRAKRKNGNYTKLNNALIPSEGNEVEGSSYSYEDTPPASGAYYYKLEDVDYNETTTMHGPKKVRVRK